jgi:hypothetical protein
VKSRAEDLRDRATRRIDSGDIVGAREILTAPETVASGPLTFMLAETYDPNMLASWQAAGGAYADPGKARVLYERALALGEARARQRLQPDWLGTPAPRVQLSAGERARAEMILALGVRHLEQGNVAAARVFFQRAADTGLAAGALKLAATYDPRELERLGATAVPADRNEARKWYARAHELGAPEAAERLVGLAE